MMKRLRNMLILYLIAVSFAGCMRISGSDEKEMKIPEIPSTLEVDEQGVPVLHVYDIEKEKSEEMDVETYVEGVLAGEMRNDWPKEALKAQAILARTFVMKFIETKSSRYEDADISTDISEAQAYAEGLINERIKEAVEETRGMIVSYDGEIAHTWFHAHSGGITELPRDGLDYKENPAYTKSVKSPDSENAPQEVKAWKAVFSLEEVEEAAKALGVKTGNITSIEIGQKGKSGRASTLVINGKEVSAPSLRVQIGSEKLKSTLLDGVSIENGEAVFSGRGYGHGVGMSQWGAYAMAESGKGAEEIIREYFNDVDIVKMWN